MSTQAAQDVFVTALEGGIGYWSLATEIEYQQDTDDVVYLSVKLHEYEDDPAKQNETDAVVQTTWMGSNYYKLEGHTVTVEDVGRAISEIAFMKAVDLPKYMSKGLPATCRTLVFDPDEADYDSCVADEIIQYAALGAVVYG